MNTEVITECSKCGQRFKNWKFATPCCNGLSFIVDENGNKTTRVFLSTLVKPKNLTYADPQEKTL
jgi:hypothetical protein